MVESCDPFSWLLRCSPCSLALAPSRPATAAHFPFPAFSQPSTRPECSLLPFSPIGDMELHASPAAPPFPGMPVIGAPKLSQQQARRVYGPTCAVCKRSLVNERVFHQVRTCGAQGFGRAPAVPWGRLQSQWY